MVNCSCRAVKGSGNPGPDQGQGEQIEFMIPNDCGVVGAGNPAPGTGLPGVTDVDYIDGVKYRGTDTWPTYYIGEDGISLWPKQPDDCASKVACTL